MYREAEHRAIILDEVFNSAWARAATALSDEADLNAILRGYLREFLDVDLQRRMERPAGAPVYAGWWEAGDPGTAVDADLEAIRNARDSLAREIAENRPHDMAEEEAERLLAQHGLPQHLLRPLIFGLLEAAIGGGK